MAAEAARRRRRRPTATRCSIGDTLVTICPWWDGPLGRAAVERNWPRDAARRPARWIWVYHWPPLGSPTCWTGQRHYGDADVAAGSTSTGPTSC